MWKNKATNSVLYVSVLTHMSTLTALVALWLQEETWNNTMV